MEPNGQVNLEDGSWTAVRVGPSVVGWAGSYLNVPPPNSPVLVSDINILLGDRILPLDFLEFDKMSMMRDNDNDDDSGIIIHKFGFYARRFAVRVPVGSLDLTDKGEIDFSERSWDTLRTSLRNLFSALKAAIQAELHTRSPVEVIRKLVELQSYGYPMAYYNKLSWRGAHPPMTTKGSEMQTVVIRESSDLALPKGKSLRNLLDADFALPNGEYIPKLSDTSFSLFVNLQSRTSYLRPTSGVPLMAPENVFLIRASSNLEQERAEQLLLDRALLLAFLSAVKPGAMEASIFLCVKGDPLEEWVDGEVLSAREFLKWAGGQHLA